MKEQQYIPFAIRKKLQNLYSWKELYYQAHRHSEVLKTQEQISELKAKHGIEN